MKTALVLVTGFLFNCILCSDYGSIEHNGEAGASPLYNIIYSDITDILNEFGLNNEAIEKANNESESNEDIEDLLSEYHHYLEKAHKQRANYLEKNKPKNKVPNIHHEKFTKMKSPATSKYNDYYKSTFYKQEHKFPQSLNPFSMFIPFNSNKYMTSERPSYNNDLSVIKKIMFNDERPLSQFSSVPVKSTCCKGAPVTLEHGQHRYDPMLPPEDYKMYDLENKTPMSPELLDDTIILTLKVGIQLPKLLQDPIQFYNPQGRDKMTDRNVGVSKEYLSAIKLPSFIYDHPVSNMLLGYKRNTNNNIIHDIQNPLHKITIHKKKKSKVGNTNKKHRKKVITFHNFKIEPELSISMFNMTINAKNNTDNNSTSILNAHSNKTINEDVRLVTSTTTPVVISNKSESQTEDNVLILVNITNNIDNGTNENQKTDNSIETDYTDGISNATTEKTLHLIRKREISHESKTTTPKIKSITPQNKSSVTQKHSSSTVKNNISKNKSKKKMSKKGAVGKSIARKGVKSNSTLVKPKSNVNSKKIDKNLPNDLELLFWPNTNTTKSNDIMKNITAIILENENKKSKLNMSLETMRHNHTRVLEQAIFGDADWNDVDTVAPAFISFVGKYIEGILTFCNDRICHSMKCTKQNCLHRYCAPKDRFNKGHCTGSNYTDSVASMASKMDLPSNVAFEIVDILQDRMTGKLFGKITLCINTKCITFIASKKLFHKYKCMNTEKVKELDAKGHCVLPKAA